MSDKRLGTKAKRRNEMKQSMHRRKLSTRIRNLFALCDEEGKGYVTREELFRLTKEIALTEEEVNNAFHYLDKDKNGSLSLEEFMSGFDVFLGTEQVSSKSFQHNEISDSSQLFDHIDRDRKGFITKNDLSLVAEDFGLTSEEIEAIFLVLNRKGKIVLTYKDFSEGFENLSPAVDAVEMVSMEEEIFTNGIEDEIEENKAETTMDYSQCGRDELNSILTQKATELFKVCDKDNKGYITQEDLLELTRELALSKEQVESAFIKLDSDKNNFLTLDEFVEGFGLFLGVENEEDFNPETQRRQAKARELFDLCDRGSKGYVTKSDLMRLTNDLGLTKEHVNLIFDQLDEDQNGFLTIYEFVRGFSDFLDCDELEQPCKGLTPNGLIDSDYDEEELELEKVYEKQQSVDQIDANAKQLINNIDEYIGDSLTKEQLAELWKTLQKTDSKTLTQFEEFLLNISNEIKKAKLETVHLENTLKRKALSHDVEVQRLYEEMEQQIRNEKAKVLELETRREKVMREELNSRLQEKEYQMNKLVVRQRELEDRLMEVQQQEHNLKQENLKLYQQNSELEEKLNSSVSSLEDTRSYVSSLQQSTVQEKRDRLRAAMQQTEGMQKEHESLIRQLDMLREMNQKLRDDKDAIESSMKMRTDRSTSLEDEMQNAEGKRPLEKTGSIMSAYFNSSKRGRQNSTSTRNAKYLEKQGSIMSAYFEPSRGSQESLDYGDGVVGEHRFDSIGEEEDTTSFRRRLIKAVEEDGELMSGDSDIDCRTSIDGTMSPASSMDTAERQDHIVASTPKHEPDQSESPSRRRRMLPSRHGGTERLNKESNESEDVIGHIKELRRKLSNEHVLDADEQELLRSNQGNQSSGNRDGRWINGNKYDTENGNSVQENSESSNRNRTTNLSEIGIVDGTMRHNGVSELSNTGDRSEMVASPNNNDINDDKVVLEEGKHRSEAQARGHLDSDLSESQDHTPGTEDQLSATESEADRILSNTAEEELRQVKKADSVEESKQHLKEMLDDLATPYSQKKTSLDLSEERRDKNDVINSSLNTTKEEEPPANPNRVYKIVFVGDSGVGKSSLIHRFCFDQFRTNFSATIGVDFQVKSIKVFQEWVALQLWDTAGQERFRSITKQYFRKADGVIIMFDLCSETSYKNVRNWMNSVEDSAEPECSVMLLGNKLDIADDGFRKVKVEVAERLAHDFNSTYHEVSAKSGQGVQEAMIKMAKRLAEKEDSLMKMSVLNLDINGDGKKKKKCCG